MLPLTPKLRWSGVSLIWFRSTMVCSQCGEWFTLRSRSEMLLYLLVDESPICYVGGIPYMRCHQAGRWWFVRCYWRRLHGSDVMPFHKCCVFLVCARCCNFNVTIGRDAANQHGRYFDYRRWD